MVSDLEWPQVVHYFSCIWTIYCVQYLKCILYLVFQETGHCSDAHKMTTTFQLYVKNDEHWISSSGIRKGRCMHVHMCIWLFLTVCIHVQTYWGMAGNRTKSFKFPFIFLQIIYVVILQKTFFFNWIEEDPILVCIWFCCTQKHWLTFFLTSHSFYRR